MIEKNRNPYLGEILSDTVMLSGRIFCVYHFRKLGCIRTNSIGLNICRFLYKEKKS